MIVINLNIYIYLIKIYSQYKLVKAFKVVEKDIFYYLITLNNPDINLDYKVTFLNLNILNKIKILLQ